MSLSRFESRFIRLQDDYPTGMTAPAVLQRALAMLADLAADTLETDAGRARAMLEQASIRIESLFQDWADVAEALAGWRRGVTYFPAEDGRDVRSQAIREAERMMRRLAEDFSTGKDDGDTYRSSSMSQ